LPVPGSGNRITYYQLFSHAWVILSDPHTAGGRGLTSRMTHRKLRLVARLSGLIACPAQ
jgi:hypothetical protein